MVHVFSDISFGWLSLIIVLSLLMSFFLYFKEIRRESSNKKVFIFLSALRALSLFLVGLLLMTLVFKRLDYRVQKPLFISLLDNSSSMLNYKDSNEVLSTLTNFDEKIKNKFGDRFEFETFLLGEKIIENDSLNFKEISSNLSYGFDFIKESYYNDNIGGILFVSDGNYNIGSNPLISSSKIINTPIFTVGVGDTVDKVDQLIKNVVSNKVAFFKNDFPVKVLIETNKLYGRKTEVVIFNNGKKVTSKEVVYSGKDDLYEVDFVLNAKEVGVQYYTVELQAVENEFSLKNNIQNFNVEVLESRNKVLFLFDAPHPDISALKNELEKDEKVEVETSFTSDFEGGLKDVNLIIWHEPRSMISSFIQKKIEENKIPVLYMLGANTTNTIVNKLNIGLKVGLTSQNDFNQPVLSDDFQLFYISEGLSALIPSFPPLVSRFGRVEFNSMFSVMLNQRLGDVTKKEPMLYFGKNSFAKFGVLYGEGIWRWKIEDYRLNKTNDLFNELIQKVTQYLMVKKSTNQFNVITPEEIKRNEDVLVRAEFYDEAFNLTTKPIIDFEYKNEEGLKYLSTFSVEDNSYVLPLGDLPPGKYEWKASTVYNAKQKIKKGMFVVSDVSPEDFFTKSNHTLLKGIAKVSNANFYTLKDIDRLVLDIENRKDIAAVSYEEPKFSKLIDFLWFLILIIFLFTLEWFVRRRVGLQ